MTRLISAIRKKDHPAILNAAREFWGSSIIIVHGDLYDLQELPGFKAELDGQLAGFLHYEFKEDACEILTLASLKEGRGVGSALLKVIEALARQKHCQVLHLTTTNDNLHALGFYQRRGYRFAALYPGQIDISRQLKPTIPQLGDNRIPLRDEVRLELRLTETEDPGNPHA